MRRFIGSALFLLASAGWASAELSPLDAAAILTESKATNAKCAFLNPVEAEKLNLFTARAEVAAVSAESADKAGPQLQQARARGAQSACDAAAQARVREIYSSANEAMEAVNRETVPTQGPISILPKPITAAPVRTVRPPLMQQQTQILLMPQQPQVLVPAPQPVPMQPQVLVPAPQPVPLQPQVRYNFSAQQPQLPQPQPQYVYAEPAPVQQPEPQYVYAEPVPQPEPQYVYAEPAPEPALQYAYAVPQPQYVAPQPQPILSERFLARLTVVLERPEPQPVVYQTPAAVYAPVSDLMTAGLDHYAHRASAYYVEIRCQHLTPQQAQQFWQSIAAEHAAMLERESPTAIETALIQARAQADQIACSSQSVAFVQQAFQGL
jgi:hypothetical protein